MFPLFADLSFLVLDNRNEMTKTRKGHIYLAVTLGIETAVVRGIPLVTFAVYRESGYKLTVSAAFKALMYCEVLKTAAFFHLPQCVMHLSQIFRSLRRVEVCVYMKPSSISEQKEHIRKKV